MHKQKNPTIIVDGLDRIEVPDRGIIIDLLNAILNNPALDSWRIIASLRDNGTEPLQTWLPPAILVEDGVSTVEVKSFDDSEATTLADLVPGCGLSCFRATNVSAKSPVALSLPMCSPAPSTQAKILLPPKSILSMYGGAASR